MANNITAPAAAGTILATDQGASGEHYQLLKLVDSAEDSTTRTGVAANPLQVSLANTGANSNKILTTPDLPTGAATAAKQDTGNTSLGSIDTKTPALGQALAAASVPVILPAATITTLTPPAAITNYANETGGNLAAIKTDADAIKTSVETIDNAISGSEMQVDVVGALPAGTALLGKVGIDQATANANEVVTKTGSVTNATLNAETTKVIGTVNVSAGQTIAVSQSGTWDEVGINDSGNSITVDGSVTANAGTNLNTSALALETGGNLAAIKAKTDNIPAVGQAAMAASTPVAIASNQSAIPVSDGSGSLTVDGNLTVSGTNLRASTDTLDSIRAYQQVDALYVDTTKLPRKFAVIDHATSGNNTIVAAVTGKRILVLNYVLVAAAATIIRFESGADGTALTGQMSIAANSGLAPGYCQVGHFMTNVGELLNLELSAANSIDGHLVYVEV